MDAALVFAERCRRDGSVELVGFLLPLREDVSNVAKGWLADAWLVRRRTTRSRRQGRRHGSVRRPCPESAGLTASLRPPITNS